MPVIDRTQHIGHSAGSQRHTAVLAPPFSDVAAHKDALLARYITLGPVTVEQMLGRWRGGVWNTGGVFAALLGSVGWYGKVFRSAGDVDALVFQRSAAPLGVLVRLLCVPWRLPEDRSLSRHPLGAARLETRALYGVQSVAMCYRHLPIADHFRRIDDRRVMGLMQIAGRREPELFFWLERT